MNEYTVTHKDLQKIRLALKTTTTFSKRGLSNNVDLGFDIVGYLVDQLVDKCEVKVLGYGLFKKLLPMSKYEFGIK